MKSLRIVIHNDSSRPIFIDFRIPDDLARALESVKVTRAEFLIKDTPFYSVPDLGKSLGGIVDLSSGLNDFRITS